MTHKAYLDFMKNVAENLEKRVQHVVNHGVEVLKKENPTQQDVEEVWNEIRSLHKDIGSNAADAAQGEIKERVVNYHQSLGLTKEAAESKFKDVFDLGEKARAAAPQVIGKTKALWIKLMAAASAGVAVGLVSFSLRSGNKLAVEPDVHQTSPPHSPVQESSPTFDPSPALMDYVETSSFDPRPSLTNFVTVSDVQLGNFVRSIAQPPMPLSDSVISELPEAVANAKDEPVSVIVNGHAYHQTVGSIYSSRETPDSVREAVKEHAEKEYQYATMTTHHIYVEKPKDKTIQEEKTFKMGSFDGKKNTDMGAITLKLGNKKDENK